jgi:DNA-binding PadR family transcriptional regulator
LKDKGYSLQEYIVLEKIYVTIEERKKEARFAIEKEIEGLIGGTKAPEEPDIGGLLQRLREAGLVFEEEDVRRMIRRAVLRNA